MNSVIVAAAVLMVLSLARLNVVVALILGTLGPTMGLNVDGQHSHIWDTVVPTFLHFNLPLLAFGWLAAMVL